VALSGGSTPKLLYELLASDAFRYQIPWHLIHFFFGDERWVPHTDPASNFKLANDYLFQPLNINRTRIYPMPTSGDPQDAATHYEVTLRGAFNLQEGEVPAFDLIFLGMGDEGHTASLFPHTAVLHENVRLVPLPMFPSSPLTASPSLPLPSPMLLTPSSWWEAEPKQMRSNRCSKANTIPTNIPPNSSATPQAK
jgi:6-phosphogluconolactonase